jgi:hypothetical protein
MIYRLSEKERPTKVVFHSGRAGKIFRRRRKRLDRPDGSW